jgi:osmotically-inducible protein OsmY
MKSTFSRGMVATCLMIPTGVVAGAQYPVAPDNTKTNQQDRARTGPTADQGGGTAADRDLMQRIRKALVDDSSLSTYAHNAKIISQGGKVTLKGPVRSEQEKQAIEPKAIEVAGAGNVTNDLTVMARPAPKH